jgi:DNA-directed RNA polymerase subunit RPC12/RpoP
MRPFNQLLSGPLRPTEVLLDENFPPLVLCPEHGPVHWLTSLSGKKFLHCSQCHYRIMLKFPTPEPYEFVVSYYARNHFRFPFLWA